MLEQVLRDRGRIARRRRTFGDSSSTVSDNGNRRHRAYTRWAQPAPRFERRSCRRLPIEAGGVKVVHLISSSGVYGAEKMVVGLCEALAQFGVDASLEVFDNQHSRNVDVADFARAVGVPVTLLRCGGRFDPGPCDVCERDLAGADLLHTHGYKANLYGFPCHLGSRVRIVATNHRFDTGPHNRLDGPVLRRVDAVFAVSDEARDSFALGIRQPMR